MLYKMATLCRKHGQKSGKIQEKKEMTRVMKVSAKKWAGGIAEEGLSSITSGVGRFTVRVIERMVTSIK